MLELAPKDEEARGIGNRESFSAFGLSGDTWFQEPRSESESPIKMRFGSKKRIHGRGEGGSAGQSGVFPAKWPTWY